MPPNPAAFSPVRSFSVSLQRVLPTLRRMSPIRDQVDAAERRAQELMASRQTPTLTSIEVARAAVMAAVCAAVAVIAVIIPHAGWLGILGAVPMGLLAFRHRIRVVIAAAVAAAVTGFLLVGLSGSGSVALCALVGAVSGSVKRRGRGLLTLVMVSLGLGALAGALVVGTMAVLAPVRKLAFDSATTVVDGIAVATAHVPMLAGVHIDRWFVEALNRWQLLVWVVVIAGFSSASLFGWWMLSHAITRLGAIPNAQFFSPPADGGAIAPVPLRLTDVRVRHPSGHCDALRSTTVQIQPAEHLAVTGANGSGKTTLTQVLAGREPTSGTVDRPGAVGLGRIGGTAIIMQHPESQVLGMLVADDVVWGLPPGTATDVDQILADVGLAGLGGRQTDTLSGGELQRLAVAAAIARQPSLLIADEVTAMVDHEGRRLLLDVLFGLCRRHATALVHITHYREESEYADRTIDLSGPGYEMPMVTGSSVPAASREEHPRHRRPILELAGVGHVYDNGTPWARTALHGISLRVDEGDSLLIHGNNGSGKSTLAWIMAGLTAPTTGACSIDQQPATDRIGAVALQFQTARLQVLRHRVDHEIASSAGFSFTDRHRVAAALLDVGLGPEIAEQRVDQLSGGQLRRVVLAGLLARSPRVLILDEPMAGLDAAGRRALVEVLARRRRDDGLTLIVISHDFAGLEHLCTRTVHLVAGSLSQSSARTTVVANAPTDRSGRRSRRPMMSLRPVPGDSVIHRLRAGTKLLTVFALSVLVIVQPSWLTIGSVAALTTVGALLARIPRGALPSPPRWVWAGLVVLGVVAALAGGSPDVRVGTITIGLGGLMDFARVTALPVVLLALGSLLPLTTNTAEIAPAVATLGQVTRRVRVPVDEWSVALALALRALPMLVDDIRVLRAAYRMRPPSTSAGLVASIRRSVATLLDMAIATMAVAERRADAMGAAIAARGGFGQIAVTPGPPRSADWVTLALVAALFAAVCAGAAAVGG